MINQVQKSRCPSNAPLLLKPVQLYVSYTLYYVLSEIYIFTITVLGTLYFIFTVKPNMLYKHQPELNACEVFSSYSISARFNLYKTFTYRIKVKKKKQQKN